MIGVEHHVGELRRAERAYRAATDDQGEAAGRRRRAVEDALAGGVSYQQVADVLGLSRSAVQSIVRA